MSRWYRAYVGTVTDSKLAEVALIAGSTRSVAVAAWHALLEDCANNNNGGQFSVSPRRIAAALCEPVALIEQVMAGFAEVGLVDGDRACAWGKRQFEGDNADGTNAKRQAAWRERKRNASTPLRNAPVTPLRNGPVTTIDRYIDIEEEQRGQEASLSDEPVLAPPAPTQPPDPDASPEDAYWALAPQASAAGIARSRLGQLFQACNGDAVAALAVLRQTLRAKQPSPYFSATLAKLRAEAQPPPPTPAVDPDEPEIIKNKRRYGVDVEVIERDGKRRYRAQNVTYDERGQEIGW